MKLNADNWKNYIKSAVKDCTDNGLAKGASEGICTAVGSIRYIRDGVADDIGKDTPEAKDVVDSLNELIEQLTGKEAPKMGGFACNASAAAAFAGLKDAESVIAKGLTS